MPTAVRGVGYANIESFKGWDCQYTYVRLDYRYITAVTPPFPFPTDWAPVSSTPIRHNGGRSSCTPVGLNYYASSGLATTNLRNRYPKVHEVFKEELG